MLSKIRICNSQQSKTILHEHWELGPTRLHSMPQRYNNICNMYNWFNLDNFSSVQPKIRLSPTRPNNEYRVLLNTGFVLSCFAELFPIHSIGWFRVQGPSMRNTLFNGVIFGAFVDLAQVRTSTNSPLNLLLFNPANTGVYVCAANTVYTLSEDTPVFATANITVIGKQHISLVVDIKIHFIDHFSHLPKRCCNQKRINFKFVKIQYRDLCTYHY